MKRIGLVGVSCKVLVPNWATSAADHPGKTSAALLVNFDDGSCAQFVAECVSHNDPVIFWAILPNQEVVSERMAVILNL